MGKYIVKDWAGNILDFKSCFKLPQLAVAMEFETMEDAYIYLDEINLSEEDMGDIYVDQKEWLIFK